MRNKDKHLASHTKFTFSGTSSRRYRAFSRDLQAHSVTCGKRLEACLNQYPRLNAESYLTRA